MGAAGAPGLPGPSGTGLAGSVLCGSYRDLRARVRPAAGYCGMPRQASTGDALRPAKGSCPWDSACPGRGHGSAAAAPAEASVKEGVL